MMQKQNERSYDHATRLFFIQLWVRNIRVNYLASIPQSPRPLWAFDPSSNECRYLERWAVVPAHPRLSLAVAHQLLVLQKPTTHDRLIHRVCHTTWEARDLCQFCVRRTRWDHGCHLQYLNLPVRRSALAECDGVVSLKSANLDAAHEVICGVSLSLGALFLVEIAKHDRSRIWQHHLW